MKDVIVALFSSRKFLLAVVVIVAFLPLVYLGRITVDKFIDVTMTLVVALIAAIGVEGAAEKFHASPATFTRTADSLQPPPPKTLEVLVVPPMTPPPPI